MQSHLSEPPQLSPAVPGRRRARRRLAAGLSVLVLGAVGVAGAIDTGGGEPATHLESAEGAEPAPVPGLNDPSTSTSSPAASTSSTAVSASTAPGVTTTTRRKDPTSNPTSALNPSPTTTSPGAGTSTVTTATTVPANSPDEARPGHQAITIGEAGIWVLDVTTGATRRVAEAGTFDVGGETLFTARGRDVYATPLAGGATVKRYTAPSQPDPQLASGYHLDYSREVVDGIEASADGTAVLAVFAPVIGPGGAPSGRNGDFYLVDPEGQRIQPEHPLRGSAQWSVDGTQLATTSFGQSRPDPNTTPVSYLPPAKTLVVLGRDGKTLKGPYSGPKVEAITKLGWASHGRALAVADSQTAGFHRLDLASGAFSPVPDLRGWLHIGPDDRALGVRYGTDGDGSVNVYDPATGTLKLFANRGDNPLWSPDGRWAVIDEVPGPGFSRGLLVADGTGTPRYSVTPRADLAFGRPGIGLQGKAWPGADWSASSRYLVLVARPRPG